MVAGLNINMSAQEMRRKVVSLKKTNSMETASKLDWKQKVKWFKKQ